MTEIWTGGRRISVDSVEIESETTARPISSAGVSQRTYSGSFTISSKTTNMEPDDLLNGYAEQYRDKNTDYNDVWRQVGYTMYRMAGEEPLTLDSPEDYASLGLYWERLIKLYRAFNGEYRTDLSFEDVAESHGDASTYAAMHASLSLPPATETPAHSDQTSLGELFEQSSTDDGESGLEAFFPNV